MKKRRSDGVPLPPFGFADRSQGGLENRRPSFLPDIGLLHRKEAADADIGVRDGVSGDRCDRFIGLDDMADLRADLLFTKAQQDMAADARGGGALLGTV